MGVRNYLIEGVSGAGKTAVAGELERRGLHVIHGDRLLAYRGDPETGVALKEPEAPVGDMARWRHAHWIWSLDRVRAAVADQSEPRTFFCGGARNHHRFIDLFDGVFVLEIDAGTLDRRLATRPEDEFGGRPKERRLIMRLHATGEDLPRGAIHLDATRPIADVVDEILLRCGEAERVAG